MLNRVLIWIRLGFNEVVYWVVGDTPEAHHARAAFLWEELGSYRKCISHCQRYLAISEDRNIRVMLAYCYSLLEQWEKSVEAYRTVSDPMYDPRIALGLAEAELNVGNETEARKIFTAVSAQDDGSLSDLSKALEDLGAQLNVANDVGPDT